MFAASEVEGSTVVAALSPLLAARAPRCACSAVLAATAEPSPPLPRNSENTGEKIALSTVAGRLRSTDGESDGGGVLGAGVSSGACGWHSAA